MGNVKSLIISPHIDDELLGCFSFLNENTHVVECGVDEFHIVDRNERLRELKNLSKHCGFTYQVFDNVVNNYVMQDLIPIIEEQINNNDKTSYIKYDFFIKVQIDKSKKAGLIRLLENANKNQIISFNLNNFVEKNINTVKTGLWINNQSYDEKDLTDEEIKIEIQKFISTINVKALLKEADDAAIEELNNMN